MPEPRAPLRANLATRLYFAWAMVWAALVTVVLATGMLVHHAFKPGASTFRFWLRAWGKSIMAGAGFRLQTEVRHPIPDGEPVVFVANHQNMLDVVSCAAGIPHSYGFAAKESLRRVPFIGSVIEHSPSIFVDRSSPRRAAESVIEAARSIRRGNSVLIYIEGERTYRSALNPFLRGAFMLAVEAAAPLVPVVIVDNFHVMDERRRAARPGRVGMVICDPIPTASRGRAAIPDLMDEVRAVMVRELEAALGPGAAQGGVSFAPERASSL